MEDLENLIKGAGINENIIETHGSDYKYRIVVEDNDLTRIMNWFREKIDYDNFKSAVGKIESQKNRVSLYGKIWALIYDHFRFSK